MQCGPYELSLSTSQSEAFQAAPTCLSALVGRFRLDKEAAAHAAEGRRMFADSSGGVASPLRRLL